MENKSFAVKSLPNDDQKDTPNQTSSFLRTVRTSSNQDTKNVQLKLKKLLHTVSEGKKNKASLSTTLITDTSAPSSGKGDEKEPVLTTSNYPPVCSSQADDKQTVILRASDYLASGHFARGTKRNVETTLSTLSKTVIKTLPAVKTGTQNQRLKTSHVPTILSVPSSHPATIINTAPSLGNSGSSAFGIVTSQRRDGVTARSKPSLIAHILSEDNSGTPGSVQDSLSLSGAHDNLPGIGKGPLAPFPKEEKMPDPSTPSAGQDYVDDNFFYDCLYGPCGLGSGPDWDMEPTFSDSPAKNIPPSIATVTPTTVSAPGSEGKNNTGDAANTPSSLLIRDENCSDTLRQDIVQALPVPCVRVVAFRAALDVCDAEAFQLIWVQLPSTTTDEVLGVITSIRYSSKRNKGAYVIAVTENQPEGTLQLSGVDEVLMGPVLRATIRQKYHKIRWMSAARHQGGTNFVKDAPNSPESTNSLASVKTNECSRSSTCDSMSSCGMDSTEFGASDVKCPMSVDTSVPDKSSSHTEHGRIESPASDRSSTPSWCRMEHATKEKQRRERIKDSCDQLRVLLPYVRGRKTDMASILEMTVDYLKIINAALPQEFQSQIIDIMSNASPMIDTREGEVEKMTMANKKFFRRKGSGMDFSSFGKPLRFVKRKPSIQVGGPTNVTPRQDDQPLVSRAHTSGHIDLASESGMVTLSFGSNLGTKNNNSAATVSKQVTEGLKSSRVSSASSQRTHVGTGEENQTTAMVYMPPVTIAPIKEAKKEMFEEMKAPSHAYPSNDLSHMFTNGDISANRMFSTGGSSMVMPSSDPFVHQPSVTSARLTSSDRGLGPGIAAEFSPYGGMYALDSAYYHYYQSLQDSSNGNYFMHSDGGAADYVNPNAVMPVAPYASRSFSGSSRRLDRPADLACYSVINPGDVYNNNSSNNNNNNSSSTSCGSSSNNSSSSNNNHISSIGNSSTSTTYSSHLSNYKCADS